MGSVTEAPQTMGTKSALSHGKTIYDVAKEYDYIICGGGTSGCVIAGRLAEHFASLSQSTPAPSILVIEAGPIDDRPRVPGALYPLMGGELDWKIKTVPQKHLNDRVLPLARGKLLGGSSAFNGTLCIRGHKRDYDEWNLPGWSGDEMFAYMKKSETFHGKPWFKAKEEEHGTDGPLHIQPQEPAPMGDLLLEAMESKGLPKVDDLFTTGETPNACGHAARTVYNGVRSTSADFLTKYKDQIDVIVETVVDKVNLEQRGNELVATSVEVLNKAEERRVVQARKEIVISGGTYCSPPILLRSGIGSKVELEQHGIDCKVDLPGVGKNLMDHLVAFQSYEVNRADLTLDRFIQHEGGAAQSFQEYEKNKGGTFAGFPMGVFAFARLDEKLKDVPLWRDAPCKDGLDPVAMHPDQAHIEYMNFQMLTGHLTGLPDPKDQKHGFDFMTGLFSQKSRGTVGLKSRDPFDNPLVDPHYLEDPLDMLVLSEGMRLGNEIVMDGRGLADVIKGPYPPESKHHSWKDREPWVEFARNNVHTCYHPAGTCKLGIASDPMAVVDERLRIRGVKGLRVADVSIMPTLNGGHTQMPAYAIGEKAAEMIKADWKL